MSSKKPFFSIITASFNSERTIATTIKSLLDQDFTDFEYIIVDGNSKDNTLKIIASFEALFTAKNISYRYISEKDKGVYDAWNKGVKLSEGEWISFLGSDDSYMPNALNTYFTHIQNNSNSNYISSQVQLINANGENLSVFGKAYRWEKVIRDMDTAQVGSFHKKELFEKIGFFDPSYKIVGDLDFYIRSKDVIRPAYFKEITAKMQNGGISNQIYKALKEALVVKLKYNYNPKLLSYYDFYSSLAKCYIKILIKKK
ncbi:MAG: glycosyltransferase family 2 protein [Flavobacterium sp.]|nr:glycosyltransferase family 2 protein [Flavobacterium sp.]